MTHWRREDLQDYPEIEVGECPTCQETETWIIQYDDGDRECYFGGCDLTEAGA